MCPSSARRSISSILAAVAIELSCAHAARSSEGVLSICLKLASALVGVGEAPVIGLTIVTDGWGVNVGGVGGTTVAVAVNVGEGGMTTAVGSGVAREVHALSASTNRNMLITIFCVLRL